MMSSFQGRDILSIRDLSRADIELVLKAAKKMVPVAAGSRRSKSLEGKILATLFYEPSTRTRLSFESAMARLGGRVLGFSGTEGTLVGDLRYGRTVHSLTYALAELGAHLTFVSPPTLEMPREILEHVKERGLAFRTAHRLEEVMRDSDVLYVTRIQKERFPDPQEYEEVAGSYRVDEAILRDAKRGLIIMHPLPRLSEIAPEVDRTKHAVYFKQASNALPVRMALLDLILGGGEGRSSGPRRSRP